MTEWVLIFLIREEERIESVQMDGYSFLSPAARGQPRFDHRSSRCEAPDGRKPGDLSLLSPLSLRLRSSTRSVPQR